MMMMMMVVVMVVVVVVMKMMMCVTGCWQQDGGRYLSAVSATCPPSCRTLVTSLLPVLSGVFAT